MSCPLLDTGKYQEVAALNAFDAVRKRFGLVAAGALLLGSMTVMGVGSTSAHEGVAHPAHIHTGACPAPGDVIFPLSDVGGDFLVDGESGAGEVVGSDAALAVDVSVTNVETALADIVAEDHAIVVHESAENIGNYILCGDIGGTMLGESDLAVALGPLNDSGASGIAWLHDNGDGTTEVKLAVTMGDAGEGGDAATPDGDMGDMDHDMGGEEVEVAIQDFAFGDPLEIKVGTTVTWTNMDSAPHTVTESTDRIFQSESLQSGDSFSFTFEDAGEFEYFCEFHPNMVGTVIVTE